MPTRNEKIRALIVDDEPLARRGISRALESAAPDVEVVGECKNGREALAAIEEQQPDLLFLDVQMPLLDGFGVIERLGVDNLPAIVFVTAFDEHAIRAFEINALDYLLKPIDPARFQITLERAREQLKNSKAARLEEKLSALLQSIEAVKADSGPVAFQERFVVKEAGRIRFVQASEIDWVSSEGNYVKLHTKETAHLLRDSMDAMESKLNPREFVRLRRSAIVRISRIKELHPLFNGEYEVVLKTGAKISSSRRYRKRLESILKS